MIPYRFMFRLHSFPTSTGVGCRKMVAMQTLLLTLCLLATYLAHAADEAFPEREGNYGLDGMVRNERDDSENSWDYTNFTKWPKLCLTGSRQSPISFKNVNPEEVVKDAKLQQLRFSSECLFPKDKTTMRISNEGAYNVVSFARQGQLPEDPSLCTLQDPLNKSHIFHFTGLSFHAASEHQFRTLRPDVEMHISFATDGVKESKRELLVVAVMLKASATSNSTSVRALRHILVDGSFPKRHAMTTCFLTEDFPIVSLLPQRGSYLLYDGSQTRPPCTENVRWAVMTSPIFISRIAVGKLRDAMDTLLPNDFHRFGNARPPQALNGRRILRFEDRRVQKSADRKEASLNDAWSPREKLIANASDDMQVLRALEEAPPDGEETMVNYGGAMGNATSSDAAEAPSVGAGRGPAVSAVANGTNQTIPLTQSKQGGREAMEDSASAPFLESQPNTTGVLEAFTAGSSASSNSSPSSPLPVNSIKRAVRPSQNTSSLTSTTNTTTSTSAPHPSKGAGHGGGKRRRGPSRNTSEDVSVVSDSRASNKTSAWRRAKTFSRHRIHSTVVSVRAHPFRALFIALFILTPLFLVATCCRRWRRPVYVVGVDPAELQPLNSANRSGIYGGTGGAAV